MTRDQDHAAPDDDLQLLFAATLREIQPGVAKPAVRDVIARARGTRHQSPAGKPTPLAAILAVAATPLIALGAVLIGPAGADMFSDSARPMPAASAPTEEPLPPLETPSTQPAPTTTGPATSADPGASAITPQREVTVFFADALLVEDGCRRLTAATRLVPAEQEVDGALRALVDGPFPDERAAGLVSQFSATPTAPPVTLTTDPVRRMVVLDTDATFFAGTSTECRHDDIWRSLQRTVEQFDGWSFELRLAGSADAAAALLEEDPTRPLDGAPDLSSIATAPDGTGVESTGGPGTGVAGGTGNPPGSRVAGFTLVNADTDTDIRVMSDGETLDLSDLPTRNVSIRADTEPAAVGSVGWVVDGERRSTDENGTPYAILGDNQGDYNPWTPIVGTHVVQAIPYSAPGGGGTSGAALSITFSVVD